MSFWDQVRRLFGGGGSAQQNAVRDAMLSRVARRESFTALDIANEVTASDPNRTADDLRSASDQVHRFFRDGLLTPLGYGQDASGNFSPQSSPPIQQPPPNVVSAVGGAPAQTPEQRLRASIHARAGRREAFTTMDLVYEITRTGAPDFMQIATLAANLAKELLPGLGYALDGGVWRHGIAAAPTREQKIRQALQSHGSRRESFTAMELAAEITRTNAPDFQDVLAQVIALAAQVLPPMGYALTNGRWVHSSSAAPPVQQQQQQQQQRPPNVVPFRQAPPPPPPPPVNLSSYQANPEILGLSADELRKRAVKINPYRTAWIGRVDTIPPQSDERTAIIDRGLILRGLLTEAQIAEIHRVGDLWLRFSDAEKLADAMAHRSADAAIEAIRQEKAKKRAEKKAVAEAKEKARVEAVAKRRAEDIIYLGRGVSKGLADRRSNLEALQANGLPAWSTPADVAKALGLTIKQLRWLCFHAEATKKTHYVYFEIPKRSGGKRLLSAPHEKLKEAQRKLHGLLAKLPLGDEAHGFVKGRSVVSNATPHVGQGVVLNVDLKDFFPTVTFRRVRGLFQSLGYSPAVATVLGLLCTEAPRRKVKFNDAEYWVAVGERCLPQGAPTSPVLANLVTRKLDRRLKGRLGTRGWVYTRYADDLSFSRKDFTRAELGFVHASIRHVVQDEGFALNPKKGRAQGKGGRQDVTGVVVNVKPGVPREEVRRLRAILHQAKKTGLEAQNREKVADFRRVIEGKIAWVTMIDRAKGERLKAAFDALPR
ncbi:MAG: reverse transcriptase family protein [Myxococcota bacterium]